MGKVLCILRCLRFSGHPLTPACLTSLRSLKLAICRNQKASRLKTTRHRPDLKQPETPWVCGRLISTQETHLEGIGLAGGGFLEWLV